MLNNPAIVVSAFNRVMPLQRLLNSLANAHYHSNDITLIISIDKSNKSDVITIAENFEWKFGPKKIIIHQTHLGLKNHIISCGDLSWEYNSVIILEDDLLVSPYFYQYAQQASRFYKDEEVVAGISLYNYQVAESCFYPFKAIDDGSDVYFMQIASSWGQLWTKNQWLNFKNWFTENPELSSDNSIPEYLKQWSENSWKKHFIHYLIANNKYFVFPRLSLTTNFEEFGTNSSSKNVFHVPLQISPCNYKFQEFVQSKSMYDTWFEILPKALNQFNQKLIDYNYEVDLYGTKTITINKQDYILTSKKSENPIQQFSAELFPLETNIAINLHGDDIGLFKKENTNFQKAQLPLRNYLEDLNKKNNVDFSIIIPIIDYKEETIIKTLNSIVSQNYKYVELLIFVDKTYIKETEVLISDYEIRIKLNPFISSHSLDDLICLGIQYAENEIITWISPGTEFSEDALFYINSIFKSYLSINWIRGINETVTTKHDYDRLDVFNYRLVKNQVYKQIKSQKLEYSIEETFLRKTCLTNITNTTTNLQHLFFYLIDNYQLNVVVKCFFDQPQKSEPKLLSKTESDSLLKKYQHFNTNIKLKAKIINFFLQNPIIGEESSKWYYTSLNNFPDVLRFDESMQTFYLNKF